LQYNRTAMRDESIQMPEVESLEPGINGLVYEHGDVIKLATVCRSVLTDHALRKKLSNVALETVLSPGGRNLDGMVNGTMKAIRAVSGRNF
jgi:hypothetical protein